MSRENFDILDFTSPQFENANMTVLYCREAMERTGMTEEATRLRGLDVTNAQTAEVALNVLKRIRAKAEAEYCREAAVSSLRSALNFA